MNNHRFFGSAILAASLFFGTHIRASAQVILDSGFVYRPGDSGASITFDGSKVWTVEGKVVEINEATKTIKVKTPKSATESKIVTLAVNSATMLSKEYSVAPSELRVGDKVINLENDNYALEFFRTKPGTVINLTPLTLKVTGRAGISSSDKPLPIVADDRRESDFDTLGTLTMLEPESTFSEMSTESPAQFTVKEAKVAQYYAPVPFSDFAVGKVVVAIVYALPRRQIDRITLTSKP